MAGNKKANIYTKTGDKGETSLVGGQRVHKTHPRIEAYGTLDELNSVIGLLRAEMAASNAAQKNLEMVQNNLFNIGSHLACEDESFRSQLPGLSAGAVSALEVDMDRWESALPALRQFILPGGSRDAALAHLARSVCRRAERLVVGIGRAEVDGNAQPVATSLNQDHLIFINRLSDWFFLLARQLNSEANVGDVPWKKG